MRPFVCVCNAQLHVSLLLKTIDRTMVASKLSRSSGYDVMQVKEQRMYERINSH